jgi:hypothetical protein
VVARAFFAFSVVVNALLLALILDGLIVVAVMMACGPDSPLSLLYLTTGGIPALPVFAVGATALRYDEYRASRTLIEATKCYVLVVLAVAVALVATGGLRWAAWRLSIAAAA